MNFPESRPPGAGPLWAAGLALLSGLTALYGTGFLFLQLHGQVSAGQAWVFPLTVGSVLWLLFRKQPGFPRSVVTLFGLLMLLVAAAVAISGPFHDFSWDGMTSRALQVRWMAEGFPAREIPTMNFGHVLSAYLLETTGNWNAGKAVNLLLMVACFCLVAASLIESGCRFARGLALLITLNPVAICQISTFQVDGHVASLLSILIVSLAGILQGGRFAAPAATAALLATVGLTLAKNSGIFYAGLVLGIFAVTLAIRTRSWKPLGLVAGLLAMVMVVFGFALRQSMNYGALTLEYVRKATSSRGVGYGFTPGSGASQVEEYGRSSKLKQFLASNFSYTESIPDRIKWKPPFWMIRREIRVFEELTPDPRSGGFGPLYGTALLTGWATLVLALVSGRLRPPWHAWFATVAVVATSFPTQVWWARWVPQLWFLVLVPFLLLADPANRPKTGPAIRLGAILTLVVLAINLGTILLYYGLGMVRKEKILRTQFEFLARLPQPISVHVPKFTANKYWLEDEGLACRWLEAEAPRPRMKLVKTTHTKIELPGDWRNRLRDPRTEEILRKAGLVED